MNSLFGFVASLIIIIISIVTLYTACNYISIKNIGETKIKNEDFSAVYRMKKVLYLLKEYKVLFIATLVISIIWGVFIELSSAVSFNSPIIFFTC